MIVPLDDEKIFRAVEKSLQHARSLAGARIVVGCRDGLVTLSGFALTMRSIATAGRLALRVRGVSAVSNEVCVADRSSLWIEQRRVARRASHGAFLDYVRGVFAEHSRRARALGASRASWLHRLSQRGAQRRIRATNLYDRD